MHLLQSVLSSPLPLATVGELARDPYIIAILVYLIALTGVGVYKAKSVKDSSDFMVAGRSLPWYILVGTLLATWIGNGSLFGGAGLGYRNGLAGLWSSCGAWLGIVIVYFIAKRVRNVGKVTVPEIFESRYGKTAGMLATLITIIAYLTIVSYQFKGGGKVLSTVTGGQLSVEAGIIITAGFAISYTVLAGMLSVVYTDVVNGVLMIVGILAGLAWLVFEIGGLGDVMTTANELGRASLFGQWGMERAGGTSAPIIAISFMVPTMLLLLGDANCYQRIFSAKDGGSAKKAVLFWVVGVIVLESAISFLGLTGAVAEATGVMPASDIPRLLADGNLNPEWSSMAEGVIPRIAMALPLGLGMVLVATMMAVIVSTADSFLLIPATNLTRDVYQRYFNPEASERTVVRTSRFFILLLGAIAYSLVNSFPTILAAAYTAYLIYGTAITPSLLAAFTSKRVTKAGAIASILSGATVTLVWTFYFAETGAMGYDSWNPFLKEVTYPAAGLSILALIVGSLITQAPTKEVWGPFFNEDSEVA